MAASSRSGTRVVGMRANAWRCALRPIFVVSREGAEADKSALAVTDAPRTAAAGAAADDVAAVSFAAGVVPALAAAVSFAGVSFAAAAAVPNENPPGLEDAGGAASAVAGVAAVEPNETLPVVAGAVVAGTVPGVVPAAVMRAATTKALVCAKAAAAAPALRSTSLHRHRLHALQV